MSESTETTSFSTATTSTTVSESTADGGVSTTTTTSTADSAHPTPVMLTFSSVTPSFFAASSASLLSPSASTSASASSEAGGGGGASEEGAGDGAEVAPEEESTAQYAPVVKLQEVAVTTGEEDEEPLYTQRAALYRFDAAVSEWKERGKGDVKLLKSKSSGKVRALMRQEKTLKLCINHIVLPSLELKPNAGSDRSWTWRTKDYAGDAPEDQTFAIRFKDSDTANAFKEEWNKVRESNGKILGEEA